jgi:hypothetical protein
VSDTDNLRPVVPEGTYLARSRGSDGVYRALLFEEGTGKLLGPPELVEIDDDEPVAFYGDASDSREARDAEICESVDAVLTLLGLAVVAAPHVKRLWNERGRPAIASMRSAIDDRLGVRHRARPKGVTAANDVSLDSADPEADATASDEGVTSMGSAEAQERLRTVLVAAALIADQMRRLSHARIEDVDEARPELTEAVENLSAQQVAERISWMLESRVALLDDETVSAFMRVFATGRFVAGQYVLPRTTVPGRDSA